MTERIVKAKINLCRCPKQQSAQFDAYLNSEPEISQIFDFEWNDIHLFRGYVNRRDKKKGGTPALYHVQCVGINYDLYRDYSGVSDSYSGFTSEIAQDISEDYLSKSVWTTDIDDSDENISNIEFKRNKVGECYEELSTQDGYYLYADWSPSKENNILHYKDTPSASQKSLTDSDSFTIDKWEVADEKIRNIVTVKGSGNIQSYATGNTIETYGPNSYTYKNEDIASQGRSDAIAQALLDKFEDPNENGVITIPGDPTISLDKKISLNITGADYNIDDSFEVVEITHKFNRQGYKTTLKLEESEWSISDDVSDLKLGRYGY